MSVFFSSWFSKIFKKISFFFNIFFIFIFFDLIFFDCILVWYIAQ